MGELTEAEIDRIMRVFELYERATIPGERAAAEAALRRILPKHGFDFTMVEELGKGQPEPQHAPPPPPPRHPRRGSREEARIWLQQLDLASPQWPQALELCLLHDGLLSRWHREQFLPSLNQQRSYRTRLTPNQQQKLREALDVIYGWAWAT
jgi:hypothetical protein